MWTAPDVKHKHNLNRVYISYDILYDLHQTTKVLIC